MPLEGHQPFRPQFVTRPGDPRGRPMVLLDAVDSARLHEPVRTVARRIDARLGPSVIADRLACGDLPPHGHGWLLPWFPALTRLRRRATELASTGRRLILRTDVEDCFPCIAPRAVEASLVRAGAHPSEAGRVRSVLEALSETGLRGLPVGPAASSVLANAVLSAGDASLSGTPFLRWVDDYFVFVRDLAEAEAVLQRLSQSLGAYGLRLSEDKTSIGATGAPGVAGCSGVGGVVTGLQSLPT